VDWLHDSVADLRAAYFASRRKPLPEWASWKKIAYGARTVRVLWHRPPGAGGKSVVIVYFHGGGWIVGSPETHADISCSLSQVSGLELISVDYGLAPEHQALDQIADALTVLSRLPGRQLILCGDSAGAAIALAADLHTPQEIRKRIVGVCSLYGGFGVLDSSTLQKHGNRADGLDRACVQRYWSLVNGAHSPSPFSITELAQPSSSPVYLLAASQDPVREDTYLLAEKMKIISRKLVLEIAQGAPHGFLQDPAQAQASRQTLANIASWIRSLA
jgi:acetyl esterase